jgi:hypothetical protein
MAPTTTLIAETSAERSAMSATNNIESFDSLRAAWVAKGRPADIADPYWASVIAAQNAPKVAFVEPLVIFG